MQKILMGEIFRRAKLFFGRNFRHFSKNLSLSRDKVSPDNVCTVVLMRLREKSLMILSNREIIEQFYDIIIAISFLVIFRILLR